MQFEVPASVVHSRAVPEVFAEPINASTRYCAVHGFPVKHSASPAFQNAGLAALGLNWRYLAFETHPEDLRAAIEGARAMKFIGLNLTVPHKLLAYDMVEALDESARTWGAVNTIRFEAQDGEQPWVPLAQVAPERARNIRAHGFNTDADAITRSITEDLGLSLRGSRVLLLGAGGAGRTAALKLAAEGVSELYLVNRTVEKAIAVAEEIGRRYPGTRCQLEYPRGPVDLALNATSLGLRKEDGLPFDARQWDLKQAGAAYDMIYRPAETRFLAQARAAGCRATNGVGMLLYQGVKALEIWTGRAAPVAVMREALLRNVYV
jgi:shikimate dehydrogenase